MSARASLRRALGRARQAELVVWQTAGRALGWRGAWPARGSVDRLGILVHVPTYPPTRVAGSEISMAATVAAFIDRGHEVRVIVDAPPPAVAAPGVEWAPTRRGLVRAYRWCDVVFTQLATRNRAMRLGALTGTPVVQFLRMGGVDPDVMLGVPDLLVFTAEWLRRGGAGPTRSVVLHPPIDPARYRTRPGHSVALVNLSTAKGAPLFFEIARRLPDVEFLAVRGQWGDLYEPRPLPPNVTVMDPVEDMRAVYGLARILLEPSTAEAYGRVGVEAACSGIPTIASDLPGTREALADAACFLDPTDPDAWESAIRALDDAAAYAEASRAALRLAEERHRETVQELDTVEATVREIVAARRGGSR